ncbi:unnamed protein product [Cylindrotheca closterium]|uniref:Circumsporozoite protein n=1 Tax=Cylindrotheca closterium TaxID=2856 RepID=A0AAD2GEL7_9STRA|nr:unnamed protein product [Cylindrotheca closterium]
MRRDFEEKEKKRREEFENKEKLRQQEIKDLNTKLAKQRAEEEARKEERKKRKKKITIVGVCCIIVLVGAGAATFVSLTQDETTTPFENLEDATSVPSSAPSNGPTVTQLYQPPSEDDCLAIATNQTIVGQENLEQTDFDIAFDVTLQSGCDLTAQDVQILLDSIQQTILPSLAGCPTQTATRRGLRANKGNPMIRGTVTQKQRQLAIGDSRFVISNGFATGGVDSTFVCGDTQDSSHRIVVNLFLTLNGPVELTDLVSLTFDQIADLLKNAGQEGDNLKDPLGLNDSFSELRLVRVGDQDVPTAAPTPMPSTDSGQTPSPTAVVALTLSPTGMPVVGLTSQAPSSSPSRITALPSMRPTLAPVSGPTPPPTASPTARPSDTPSSQPSSLPTLAPTLAPVVGPTLPPTPLPTAIPSEVPSSSPSKSPTPVPTPGPTPLPSSNPSIQSSMAPSSNPSIQPSTVPSVVPSLKPSMNPSQTPTVFTQQCFESNFELGSQVGNWFGTTLQKTTVENTYGPIGDWCFGTGVTSMRFLFQYRSTFNEDISNWDVSSVTNMAGMFELATSFNQDLSSWDVSSLIDISAMFRDASSFNQDLCPWGPRLPIPNQSVVGAFVDTSCPFQSDPSFASNPPGPFCTFCPLTAVGPGPSM